MVYRLTVIRFRNLAVISTLITIASINLYPGCVGSHNADVNDSINTDLDNCSYELISVTNELGSYSLEYPSHYKKESFDSLELKIPSIQLVFISPSKSDTVYVLDSKTDDFLTVAGEWGTSFIYVNISNYKIYLRESYSATDKIESVLEDEAKRGNFKLLEHSSITVAGIKGELIVYLVDRLNRDPSKDDENLDYIHAVYFDYDNLTWQIVAKCSPDIRDEVITHFNHLIETFEIRE